MPAGTGSSGFRPTPAAALLGEGGPEWVVSLDRQCVERVVFLPDGRARLDRRPMELVQAGILTVNEARAWASYDAPGGPASSCRVGPPRASL